MVGFMIGLGDRHLENILLNTKTGECVHVDFDCLFDKAKTFKVPEQVCFRLTSNVIDGFGVSGVEGVFKKSCEIVLKVLRDNRNVLKNTLATFVNDPLIEYDSHAVSKIQQSQQMLSSGGYSNNNNANFADEDSIKMYLQKQSAKRNIVNIELRLSGKVPVYSTSVNSVLLHGRASYPDMNKQSTEFSVHGQVEKLVHQATDKSLLSKMYPGWMPFL